MEARRSLRLCAAALTASLMLPHVAVPVGQAAERASGTGAGASEAEAGAVSITDAYIRPSLRGAPNSVAYMTLSAPAGDRLLEAASPAARAVELHASSMDGGIMKMRPVVDLVLDPGRPTELRPGGLHIMLLGVHGPLEPGTTVPLTLTFEKAGDLTFDVPVENRLDRPSHHHGGDSAHTR